VFACEQGIADCAYILKGIDKQERIAEEIVRLIERAQAHKLELELSPTYSLHVDGIPVSMGDMAFRTFYCLCELSKQSLRRLYTPEEILDQLDEAFGDVFSYRRSADTTFERAQVLARQRSGHWWKSQWVPAIVSAMLAWARYKTEADDDHYVALGLFEESNVLVRVYKNALWLFDLYRRAHPTHGLWADQADRPVSLLDRAALAAGFEEAFGGVEYESRSDYDLDNVKKHMNEIRAAIHEAFKAAHRFVEPRTEILIHRQVDEANYGYRAVGEIRVLHDDDQARRIPFEKRDGKCHVLLVENDEYYLQRMRELLETGGFRVSTATNAEDAVAIVSESHRVDLISLDLHIPLTRREYDDNPASGTADGGLRALQVIKRKMPDVKVLVPTTLSDRDDLREMAAQLGVPVTNFVPKGGTAEGAAWEGHFLLTTSRLRQEVETQTILPAVPWWRCPLVRVVEGSEPAKGLLKLEVSGRRSEFRSKEGNLVALLLKRAREEVSYKEVEHHVWGQPPTPNARNSKINDIRKKIRSQWLGLGLSQTRGQSTGMRRAGRVSGGMSRASEQTGGTHGAQEGEVLETVRDGSGRERGLILHVFVEDPWGLMRGMEDRRDSKDPWTS
jgi:CheY-like chemotaxis protein